MSGQSLSQISHLFLSRVRERQDAASSASRTPLRKPPQPAAAPDADIDLSPEEFQHVYSEEAMGLRHRGASNDETNPVPPVRAVLASHLGARQFDCVRRYARGLAAAGSRVGLLWADAGELRISTFERSEDGDTSAGMSAEMSCFDGRAVRDAINELNCDLDCWLIGLANPRLPEARQLIADCPHWVLLSGCDHDSVVASYRAIKGLSELARPRISMAVLDAHGPEEADRVFRKLVGVSSQFLAVRIDPEAPVCRAPEAEEFEVMRCRTSMDKSQLASAPQWKVIAELIASASPAPEQESPMNTPSFEQETDEPRPLRLGAAAASHDELDEPFARGRLGPHSAPAAEPIVPTPATRVNTPAWLQSSAPRPLPEPAAQPPAAGDFKQATGCDEVIELIDSATAVIDAVMRQATSEIVECPVRPPMCPEARLAVTRERRLVLVAAAGQGLAELRSIGQAFRWVNENRALLAMALPQFALDAHQMPHLRLLVEQSDASAEVLQPLFQTGTCSVQTYRRIRWGQRMGLLLNAA
jgi:hypothetical protein